VLATSVLVGTIAAEDDGRTYLWHECEEVISTPGWLTSNFWSPSGGRFSYPGVDAPPAQLHFELPHDGEWAVWVRARDETDGTRLATATINGQSTYTLGGANTGQWVWYLLGFAQGSTLDLQLIRIATVANFDEWLDVLLVTDDPGFIPPGIEPEGGYAAMRPTDADRQRPAWIWWPADAGIGSVTFYRTVFEVGEGQNEVTLDLQAIAWCDVYVNDVLVASIANGDECTGLDVAATCHPGRNVLGIVATHAAWLPGVRADLRLGAGDAARHVVTNAAWRASQEEAIEWLGADFDATAWAHPCARIGERPEVGFWAWEPPEL